MKKKIHGWVQNSKQKRSRIHVLRSSCNSSIDPPKILPQLKGIMFNVRRSKLNKCQIVQKARLLKVCLPGENSVSSFKSATYLKIPQVWSLPLRPRTKQNPYHEGLFFLLAGNFFGIWHPDEHCLVDHEEEMDRNFFPAQALGS